MPRNMVELAALMAEAIEDESYTTVLGAVALVLVDALEHGPGIQADPAYRQLTGDLRDLVRAAGEAIDWAAIHVRLRGVQ